MTEKEEHLDPDLSREKIPLDPEPASPPPESPGSPRPSPRLAPDGGYGWVVVAAASIALFFLSLTFSGFAILYIDWVEYFAMDSGSIGWLGSVYPCFGNACGVLFAVFIDTYGCRIVTIIGGLLLFLAFFLSSFVSNLAILYVTYGIIGGLGFGAVALSCLVIVQQYFDKKRAIASAISTTSLSVGVMVSGPLYQYLVTQYSWRGALMIISALCLNVMAAGANFRPLQPKSKKRSKSNSSEAGSGKKKVGLRVFFQRLVKKLKDPTLLDEKGFFLHCFGVFCWAFGVLPFNAHMPSRATFLGIDRSRAALLPTFGGFATICSRLLFGFVANLKCNSRVVQGGIALLTTGSLVIINTQATAFEHMIVMCILVGIALGAFASIQSTLVVDLVGMKRFTIAQSYSLLCFGIGSMLGIPCAGYILDHTGSYDTPFYVMGTVTIAGGLAVMSIFIIKQCQKNRQQHEKEALASKEPQLLAM